MQCFPLGVIFLYKNDVLVRLIIPSESNRIESILSHRIIQSVIGQQAKSTCFATKQSNLVIDHTSLYLSCIHLIKVNRSLYIKNYTYIAMLICELKIFTPYRKLHLVLFSRWVFIWDSLGSINWNTLEAWGCKTGKPNHHSFPND